jgi:hypothetical protein
VKGLLCKLQAPMMTPSHKQPVNKEGCSLHRLFLQYWGLNSRLAGLVLYHLGHATALYFCSSYVLGRVSRFIQGQPQMAILLPTTSLVAEITDMNHHARLID